MALEEQGRSNNGERSTGMTMFFPVFIGVVRPEPLPAGVAGPVEPERIMLLNPFTQMMQLLDGAMSSDAVMEMVVSSSFAEDRKGPPPASKKSIEELRIVEVVEDEERGCSVCLESLRGQKEQGEEESRVEVDESEGAAVVVKEMPCGHIFHGGCIDKWLGMHGSCPVCRYMMPDEEEEQAKKSEERQENRGGSDGGLGGGAGFTFTIRFGNRNGDVSSRQEGSDGGHQQ